MGCAGHNGRVDGDWDAVSRGRPWAPRWGFDAHPVPPGGRCYSSYLFLAVPAPPGTTPAVTAEEAIETTGTYMPHWLASGPPEVELMIENGDFVNPDPGGMLVDRLVWVLTWRDVQGGSAIVDEDFARHWMFVGTAVVDATTGQFISVSRPPIHGRSRPPECSMPRPKLCRPPVQRSSTDTRRCPSRSSTTSAYGLPGPVRVSDLPSPMSHTTS